MKINFDDESEVSDLKKYIVETYKGISTYDAKAYYEAIKSTGLNPYNGEIMLQRFKKKNKDGSYSDACKAIITRDGYRQASQQHPHYDSHYVASVYAKDEFRVEDGKVHHSYGFSDRGELLGAYCIARRKNSKHDFLSMVYAKEYNTKMQLWASHTDTMIKKVAEAQGLRTAFQDMFVSTYSDAENIKEIEVDDEIRDGEIKNNVEKNNINEQEIANDLIVKINQYVEFLSQNDPNFDVDKMLKYFNCEKVSDLCLMDLNRLYKMLDKKIKGE